MAAMDEFNRHPVVHTWSYKLDQAACFDSNLKIDVLVWVKTLEDFCEGIVSKRRGQGIQDRRGHCGIGSSPGAMS
jgi:hypothetical protein